MIWMNISLASVQGTASPGSGPSFDGTPGPGWLSSAGMVSSGRYSRKHGSHSRWSTSGASGPEAAPSLCETWAAAVLLDPGLSARPRAGVAPGCSPDGLLRRLPSAPEDLLRQRGADGNGQ